MNFRILVGMLLFFGAGMILGLTQDSKPMGQRLLVAQAAHQDKSSEDRTDQLQQAINQGGRVVLPPGTVRITRPLVVNLQRTGPMAILGYGTTLVMEGPGPAIQIVGHHQGTADPKTLQDRLWQNQRMPVIQGLAIQGAHPQAHGIRALGTMQLVLRDIVVRGVKHALWLVQRNRNVIIQGCHFYDNRGVGVFLDRVNLHQINITGSHISYNRQGGVVVRGGEVRNLQIGSCDIEANMAPGESTANVLLDIQEGSCREVAILGCTIQHTAQVPCGANIRLLGHGAQDPRKVGNLTIQGNLLSDAQFNIHLRFARAVVIQGNVMWRAGRQHLLVQGCQQILVAGNLMDRSSDYKHFGQDQVVLENSQAVSLLGNHLVGARGPQAAVRVRRCREVLLSHNALFDCEGPLRIEATEGGILGPHWLNPPGKVLLESGSRLQRLPVSPDR